jgi:type II secretory pathway component GspD/PulD (secretin)
VIGGLTVTEVTNSRSGIPLLSGLPIIGKLFGFSKTEETRRDLIILVTPRIIDDGALPQ